MSVWAFIYESILQEQAVLLLYVVNSSGSSPGRQGFCMAVNENGQITGSVGGGIMEHKLVEYARELLRQKAEKVILKQQYHNKEQEKGRSGMICSGQQAIALVPLRPQHHQSIAQIIDAFSEKKQKLLSLSPQGLQLSDNTAFTVPGFFFEDQEHWQYTEILGKPPVIHILGGGHVGLALSEVMRLLGFYVIIYDHREGLNTMTANTFAHEKKVVAYEKVSELIAEDGEAYVAIMTFGYRLDMVLFRQLYDKHFFYLGIMGSHSKIEEMKKEALGYGISAMQWKRVHAPIGLDNFSKTPMEIAISVAAEITFHKNKVLPTGRKT